MQATSDSLVRLPKRFFQDHEDRFLPTPAIVKETRYHYFVEIDDEHLGELFDDASHYASHPDYASTCGLGLVASARATRDNCLKALRRLEDRFATLNASDRSSDYLEAQRLFRQAGSLRQNLFG